MITITAERIEELKTPAGGFNEAAMSIVGCWPLQSGWRERMIGTQVSDRNWKAAVKAAQQGPIYRRMGNAGRHR